MQWGSMLVCWPLLLACSQSTSSVNELQARANNAVSLDCLQRSKEWQAVPSSTSLEFVRDVFQYDAPVIAPSVLVGKTINAGMLICLISSGEYMTTYAFLEFSKADVWSLTEVGVFCEGHPPACWLDIRSGKVAYFFKENTLYCRMRLNGILFGVDYAYERNVAVAMAPVGLPELKNAIAGFANSPSLDP